MTWVDRLGVRWRIRMASSHIPDGARVLDVGCHDGTLFRVLGERLSGGVGIDPNAPNDGGEGRFRFIRGVFPEDLDDDGPFDAIVMLAMLEHVPRAAQPRLVERCAELLRPGGACIVSVPSALVDPITDICMKLRISDGIEFEEHYGFRVTETRPLFAAAGLQLLRQERFQAGLNNLFVFRKECAETGTDALIPMRIDGSHVPVARQLWDRAPRAVRRPVIRVMRNEALRTRFLARLNIRTEDEFATLSNGGPEAIDAALTHLDAHGVTGDYYEFGVYRGYTLWHAQMGAIRRGRDSMRFFGFDSFEGLPEIEGGDRDSALFVPGDYRCTRENVERMLEERGFDWARGALIEGFFDTALTPEVKRDHLMGPAAVVMVDCDLYQSTVPVLDFVADRLQDGTVMLFDDWYCFDEAPDLGEPRAFREFLERHPEWSAAPHGRFGAYGKAFVMHAVPAAAVAARRPSRETIAGSKPFARP